MLVQNYMGKCIPVPIPKGLIIDKPQYRFSLPEMYLKNTSESHAVTIFVILNTQKEVSYKVCGYICLFIFMIM
jgi:hypothetical protein